MKISKMLKTALQQVLSMFVVSKKGKLHTCQYCGTETTQPDNVCYAAPKPVSVCERLCKPCIIWGWDDFGIMFRIFRNTGIGDYHISIDIQIA